MVEHISFEKRIQYVAFVDNQEHIESKGWDTYFGDRKNELVFIGQDMNEKLIRSENWIIACQLKQKLDLKNGNKVMKIHGQYKDHLL